MSYCQSTELPLYKLADPTQKNRSFRRPVAHNKNMLVKPVEVSEPRVPPRFQKRREYKQGWAPLKASKHAQNTVNPIRKIVDALSVPPNPSKDPIRLNLGDPTLTGNLLPSEASVKAIEEALHEHKSDGYGPSVGLLVAREAVAQHFSTKTMKIHADNVIMASGASHALDLAITAIADPGENILVPAPGFPLYKTLCQPNGIQPNSTT